MKSILIKMSLIFWLLSINGLVISAAGPTAAAPGGQDGTDVKGENKEVVLLFKEAKKKLYAKEWTDAARRFKQIAEKFPGSKWADDSFYWYGYSLNKLSDGSNNLDDIVERKKNALLALVHLKREYPSSQWQDDARRLTMEIAGDLAERGLAQYKKYILDGTREDKEELKLLAINALMHMDKEKALPKLIEIIRENKSLKIRKNALFVLAQINDDQILPVLVEVATKDSDKEMKETAIFWLGQARFSKKDEGIRQLLEIYKQTADPDLKRKLIFSIGQSGGESAVKELINLYKKEKDLKIKKQIIFWLGQSQDPKAQAFILKIIEEKRP